MGTPVSRLIDSTPFIEYESREISSTDDIVYLVDNPFYLAPSAHPLISYDGSKEYPPEQALGVFTQTYISKGTIFRIPFPGYQIQDGVINLKPLLHAETSKQIFEAWHQVYNGYHNFDIIAHITNVRPIILNKGIYRLEEKNNYYEAINDIQPGTELYSYRGIWTWFFHVGICISSRHTLAGNIKFIDSAIPQCHPKYRELLHRYVKWLRTFLDPKISIPYTDLNYLNAYDQHYSNLSYTENMMDEIAGSISPELVIFLNGMHTLL